MPKAILSGNSFPNLPNYMRGKGRPVNVTLPGFLRPTYSEFGGSAQPLLRVWLSHACAWRTRSSGPLGQSPFPFSFLPLSHVPFSLLLFDHTGPACHSEMDQEEPSCERITTGFGFGFCQSPASKTTCQSQRDRKSLERQETFKDENASPSGTDVSADERLGLSGGLE